MERLGADRIWVAHNHPSGNPAPSLEDVAATELYSSYFKGGFAGHIILDHKEYSLFKNGFFESRAFNRPVKSLVSGRQERAAKISGPEDIAKMFAGILSKNADTTAYAVLDNKNRVVSWLYGGGNHDVLKRYVRVAGGSNAIALTNSFSLYCSHCFMANRSLGTEHDVLLDVVLVNRKTGSLVRSHSKDDSYVGAAWQHNEPKKLNYVAKNQTIQPEFKFGQTGMDPTPPLSGRDINTKENNMSDMNENAAAGQETAAERDLTPREFAFRNETWQRKVVADALKDGTCSCLPGGDGYADTNPAVNLATGKVYHGANLLYLKDHQKRHGFPTAEYATSAQVDLAKKDNPSLFIIKGQKGVPIHFSELNEDTGEYVDRHVVLFNVAQLNRPQLFKKWAEDQRLEKDIEYAEYNRRLHGDAWNPPEARERGPAPEISCSSTEPVEYLAQYLAAVSMGGRFRATQEQGKEFAQKMVDALYEPTIIAKSGSKLGEPVSDPFSLTKISREASQLCRKVINETRAGPRPAQGENFAQDGSQEQARKPRKGKRSSFHQ